MVEPSLDTWTTVFLAVAMHGMALVALLWYRKSEYKKADRLLAIFLGLFSFTLCTYVLFWSDYTIRFPHLLGIAAPFHFLYGPLLFFYVVSVMYPERSWAWSDAWHLAPFLLYVTYLLPLYLLPASEKLEIITASINPPRYSGYDMATWMVVGVKTIHMSAYAWVLYAMVGGTYSFSTTVSRISKEGIQWVKIICYCFTGFILSYVAYYILVETISFTMEHDYIIAFAMSGFVFVVGYLGFWKPSYLQEAHDHRVKYENSSLGSSEAELYREKLLQYMECEKPYMDGELRISDLAEQLSIPSHHISQIINEQFNKNYYEFVNTYRIDEAKKMLKETDPREFKILRIALESGFNNKTSFNNAFKKEVGLTPSQFRKQHKNGTNGISHSR